MNAQTPILEFHIAHVEPGKHICQREREHCRNAIRRFGKFLKREPVLADFSMENVYGFFDACVAVSSERQARRIIHRLRQTWRAAVKHGHCKWAPERRSHRTFKKAPRVKATEESYWDSTSPPEGSLPHLFQKQYRPLRLRGRNDAHNTIRLYGNTFRQFGRFLGRVPMLADLTDATVSSYLVSIVDRGCSPYTAEKERVQLLALWRFARDKRLVEDGPDVMPEKLPRRVPVAWTEAELGQLWAALSQCTGKVSGIPAKQWWEALHLVLWFTGERISAVMQLRFADFDPKAGWIIARAEYRKGRGEDKPARLPPEAVASIQAIRAPKRELIFPWDRSPTSIYHFYTKILVRAGLPTDGKRKFHCMRKSAASHYEAKGGDATSLLGHSSRRITMAYLDPRIAVVRQAADLLFTPGAIGGVQ